MPKSPRQTAWFTRMRAFSPQELPARQRNAVMALLLVNAIWGASFPMTRCLNLLVDQHTGDADITSSLVFRSATASLIIAVRFGLAFVMFAVLFAGRLRTMRSHQWLIGATIGAVFYVGMLLQVMGLGTIAASRSGFLTSLAVVFTPLVTSSVTRRLPPMTVLWGAATALLGVGVLSGLFIWQDYRLMLATDVTELWSIGDTCTILATLCFTMQILLVDYFGKRYDSLAFTPGMFLTVSVLSILSFFVFRAQVPALVRGDFLPLLRQPTFLCLLGMLSVFASLLAFSLMNKFQPTVTAVQAAVIYTLEPLFATAWALILPALLAEFCQVSYANEQVNWRILIGGGLIVLSNGLALWPQRR